jgi:hypothetical protein
MASTTRPSGSWPSTWPRAGPAMPPKRLPSSLRYFATKETTCQNRWQTLSPSTHIIRTHGPPAENHLRRDARRRRARHPCLLRGPHVQPLDQNDRRSMVGRGQAVGSRGPLRLFGMRPARRRYQTGSRLGQETGLGDWLGRLSIEPATRNSLWKCLFHGYAQHV